MNDKKYELAISIVNRLTDNGYLALFAGGYVRDMLLGLEHDDDIDIATNATPSAITSLFNHVVGVGEHFGVMLVVKDNIPFEVATFRSDGATVDGRHPDGVCFSDAPTDAQRRDFTINGLFYDPIKKEVQDYVNGTADLKSGIIRTIGDPNLRFKEDYLRLLRAVRFAARFSFSIEPQTWSSLMDNVQHITAISQERIFQELTKMLTGNHPDHAVMLLERAGLLKHILPEVQALKGVEQPSDFHPEGDVFTHTIKAISMLNNPSQTLAWSALLHDIGKPATFSNTDRIRFNNHDRVSALMAKRALQRLKSSRLLVDAVYDCIENHMNFINVQKMRLATLKKFLSRPTFDDELELHRADCLASHGMIDNYNFLLEKKKSFVISELRPEPFLKGKDLIDLNFKPGPIFKFILNRVYELQLEETFSSTQQALDWLIRNRVSLENEFLQDQKETPNPDKPVA